MRTRIFRPYGPYNPSPCGELLGPTFTQRGQLVLVLALSRLNELTLSRLLALARSRLLAVALSKLLALALSRLLALALS